MPGKIVPLIFAVFADNRRVRGQTVEQIPSVNSNIPKNPTSAIILKLQTFRWKIQPRLQNIFFLYFDFIPDYTNLCGGIFQFNFRFIEHFNLFLVRECFAVSNRYTNLSFVLIYSPFMTIIFCFSSVDTRGSSSNGF